MKSTKNFIPARYLEEFEHKKKKEKEEHSENKEQSENKKASLFKESGFIFWKIIDFYLTATRWTLFPMRIR